MTHPAHVAQPVPSRAPGWLKGVMGFAGACTPGGFLFLLALVADTHINFDKAVWFVLAAGGGAAGWFLAKKAGG
jgi:hypothetical protein